MYKCSHVAFYRWYAMLTNDVDMAASFDDYEHGIARGIVNILSQGVARAKLELRAPRTCSSTTADFEAYFFSLVQPVPMG
mmetsp:Transcript_41136/g.68381  ORF Transcript_41136/g.68381 Transcript_41136/m.68381 type:complete len:80 (-) Transcript_41136:175-414(-)